MSEKEYHQEVDMDIRGMTCDSCVLHVGKALKGVEGVVNSEKLY